ncbi:hypothetical protein PHLGIDRAFT_414287 [Phlebiopsis gigantea 11061_1 CR5-6]|uniref:F-box domain-containing protein n=1 Tax=Phlebiopsis gigantea (strain 11061_1 CR5-6) TaxID=745531 RepID=A0A0C3RZ33_PHLG1|nr:hypothetical protein PHLGIDRAFT_414287 [Phlebiopsis gigantea 11061_1 CR5-6]
MHRCLQITEIFSAILSAVPAHGSFKREGKKSTYASVARTCKLFYEPAMDAAWAILPDIVPLVASLPGDSWAKSDDGEILIVRPPEGDEWQRFLRNAARVEKLSLQGSKSATNILRAARLGVSTSTNPFSGLRDLILKDIDLEQASYLPVILNSSLRSVWIMKCPYIATNALLGHLGHLCPTIEVFHALSIPSGASGVLLHFTSLKQLTCRNGMELTPTILSHLSSLPMLETFTNSLPNMRSIAGVHSLTAFKFLRSLHLFEITDHPTLLLLLKSIHPTSLSSLELSAASQPLPNIANMTELLIAISRFTTLQLLNINLNFRYENQDDEPIGYSILPLHTLRDLRHITLRNVPVSIDDQSIHLLGKAWPNLKKLDFSSYSTGAHHVTKLTLAALGLFATYFPQLGHVAIALDATSPPSTTGLEPRSSRPINLFIEASPLDERTWPDVAAYISAVYPKAYDYKRSIFSGARNDGRWTDIIRLVPVLARARREEEQRVRSSLRAEESQCADSDQ